MQCSSRKTFDLTESMTSDYKFSKPILKNLAVAQSQFLGNEFNECWLQHAMKFVKKSDVPPLIPQN